MAYFERRDDFGYIQWARQVKLKDHFACYICGRKGVELNSHHLNSWADYPNDRYAVENGACLCRSCHDHYHDTFGKGKNTKEQFKEFEQIMGILIKNANMESTTQFAIRRILQEAEKDIVLGKILEDLDGYQERIENE